MLGIVNLSLFLFFKYLPRLFSGHIFLCALMVDYHHYFNDINKKFAKNLRRVRILSKDQHGQMKFIGDSPKKVECSHSENKALGGEEVQKEKSFHGFLSGEIAPLQIVNELENVFYGKKKFIEMSPESVASRINFDLRLQENLIEDENPSLEEVIKELIADYKPLGVVDALYEDKRQSFLIDFCQKLLESLYDEDARSLIVDLQLKIKDKKLEEVLRERIDGFGEDPLDFIVHNLALIRLFKKISKIAEVDDIYEINEEERTSLEFMGALKFGDDVKGWKLERRADLKETYFSGIDFRNVDFNAADLSHCAFVNCNFQGANLSGCKMGSIEISFSNLRGADLSEIDLGLEPAFIVFNDFSRANFTNTFFEDSDLFGNKFKNVKTNEHTSFSGSNLQQCDLTKTRLTETQILDADLTGAKLKTADN